MVRSFLNVYFNDLGFHRITAEVYDYNTRSRKLLERLGFVEEGRLRKARFWNGGFHDIIVYGLLAEEFFKGKG
ncbi:putative ribosomal N-acetyltransferase YdaF [compost metagenome]